LRKEGSSSFFEKKEPKKLLSTWRTSDVDARAPALTKGRTKSFFASFSLRGAFAVALSQKEDSCLP
jgi:hypothetical protein